MKYRIIRTTSKTKPYKIIVDPDGVNKSLGTYETIQAAKSKLRSVIVGK